jgi:outer membrane lipoprotein-sorting protein
MKPIRLTMLLSILLLSAMAGSVSAGSMSAEGLVRFSFDTYRGKASIALVDMTVHRPDWQRQVTIRAWTRGQAESLFFITAPAKDRGNGTLKKGREMWMFNPKVNRIIKLPPSMMSQAWMGSDFSNNDLSKSDSLLTDYTHEIVKTEKIDGVTVYHVTSTPKPGAPVVWGQQTLRIREDGILLEEIFYDEDLKPVKIMTSHQIEPIGGRMFPRIWKMRKMESEDAYTKLTYRELAFKETLPESLFSLSNLRNPRR